MNRWDQYKSRWDQFKATPGSSPETALEERPSEIGVTERAVLLDLSPDDAVASIKKRFGLDARPIGNGNYAVRTQKGWQKLDPSNFEWWGPDLVDLLPTAAVVAGQAKGAMLGAAGGPLGAIAGAGAGSAVAEAGLQGLYKTLGYEVGLGGAAERSVLEGAFGAAGEGLGQAVGYGARGVKQWLQTPAKAVDDAIPTPRPPEGIDLLRQAPEPSVYESGRPELSPWETRTRVEPTPRRYGSEAYGRDPSRLGRGELRSKEAQEEFTKGHRGGLEKSYEPTVQSPEQMAGQGLFKGQAEYAIDDPAKVKALIEEGRDFSVHTHRNVAAKGKTLPREKEWAEPIVWDNVTIDPPPDYEFVLPKGARDAAKGKHNMVTVFFRSPEGGYLKEARGGKEVYKVRSLHFDEVDRLEVGGKAYKFSPNVAAEEPAIGGRLVTERPAGVTSTPVDEAVRKAPEPTKDPFDTWETPEPTGSPGRPMSRREKIGWRIEQAGGKLEDLGRLPGRLAGRAAESIAGGPLSPSVARLARLGVAATGFGAGGFLGGPAGLAAASVPLGVIGLGKAGSAFGRFVGGKVLSDIFTDPRAPAGLRALAMKVADAAERNPGHLQRLLRQLLASSMYQEWAGTRQAS